MGFLELYGLFEQATVKIKLFFCPCLQQSGTETQQKQYFLFNSNVEKIDFRLKKINIMFTKNFRNKFEAAIALMFVFNIGLLIFRVFYSMEFRFIFLIWNLFLAVVPYFFMEIALKKQQNRWTPWLLLGGSLLFLPNSPYIITDLFHLKHQAAMPLWFDTLLVFSFAITGFLLFYNVLQKMHRFLEQRFSNFLTISGVITIIFLNAFGVYLGRFLRFNSWDIISNPWRLAQEILDRFIHPFAHPQTWGVTLGYGTLFLVCYVLVEILSSEKQVI